MDSKLANFESSSPRPVLGRARREKLLWPRRRLRPRGPGRHDCPDAAPTPPRSGTTPRLRGRQARAGLRRAGQDPGGGRPRGRRTCWAPAPPTNWRPGGRTAPPPKPHQRRATSRRLAESPHRLRSGPPRRSTPATSPPLRYRSTSRSPCAYDWQQFPQQTDPYAAGGYPQQQADPYAWQGGARATARTRRHAGPGAARGGRQGAAQRGGGALDETSFFDTSMIDLEQLRRYEQGR
ncbi:hypothetical protein [Streptomyces thioluteus]|uniref:hypothetical protein n=1 Tax=Streptomyces thioluteus TaxID=66431 RepID=UPI0031EF66F6